MKNTDKDNAIVELRNVTAGYASASTKEVLKDISITFEKGTITAVIGKNGSGKTTLLKAISGQIRPYRGEVLVESRDVRTYKGRELARKVAFLHQIQDMPHLSVQDLVLFGRYPYLSFPGNPAARDREIAENAMKTAGVADFCDRNLNELSGGEARKVWIAMILAQGADIVLLDEPAVFLDIRHQYEVLGLVKQLKTEGKTVIMVLHDISAALMQSDRICIIDGGAVAAYGEPRMVFESGAVGRVFNIKCRYVAGTGPDKACKPGEDSGLNKAGTRSPNAVDDTNNISGYLFKL